MDGRPCQVHESFFTNAVYIQDDDYQGYLSKRMSPSITHGCCTCDHHTVPMTEPICFDLAMSNMTESPSLDTIEIAPATRDVPAFSQVSDWSSSEAESPDPGSPGSPGSPAPDSPGSPGSSSNPEQPQPDVDQPENDPEPPSEPPKPRKRLPSDASDTKARKRRRMKTRLKPRSRPRRRRPTQHLEADANRAAKDKFLLEKRREGVTYSEIKTLGGFTEAESTLRGRFRTLTKDRDERVRKPQWTPEDIRLLPLAVESACDGQDPEQARIPWEQVATILHDNGASYRFGSGACHKMWDRIRDM